MQRLLKDVIQQLLEAEMEEHLGREKYERINLEDNKNYRNGYSCKNVKVAMGKYLSIFLEIEIVSLSLKQLENIVQIVMN